MFHVAICSIAQHDMRLVLLAASICFASLAVAAFVLHHVHATRPQRRLFWLAGVGLMVGGGAWATHFVAMLAYQPGFELSFLPGPTLLSAFLGTAGATAALVVGDRFRTLRGAIAAGALMAAGIVALHFIGMLGVDATARLWNFALIVIASAGCLLGCSAGMICGLRIRGLKGQMLGAALLAASIIELHLVAMGALTLMPLQVDNLAHHRLAGPELATLITGVAACILLVVTALALAEGRINAARLADLAARKRAEFAEAQSAAKSQFLATISHELRTPLSSITSYAELIRDTARDEGRASDATDADTIVDASRHLLALISEILDFSKMEAGPTSLDITTFAIPRLVEEFAVTAWPLAARNNNAFAIDVDPALGEMRSDIVRVRQCVLNLISNAAKFTKDGAVTLRARAVSRSAPGVLIEVIDTGIGISAKALATVFEPFKQADDTIARRYGGTGLGLSITRELVLRLGGDIAVESEPGRGSTFSIWLPLGATDQHADIQEAA